MVNLERFLPYIISLLLPGLNLLNNNPFDNDFKWYSIIPKWLIVSMFLFGLWKLIEKLLDTSKRLFKWVKIVAGSFIYITLFLVITHYFFPPYLKLSEKIPLWIFGIRLVLGAILFIVIIQSLRSAKEREKFRVENISLQSENLKAQLNQLRQQVNPHFLFNCLSTLRTMVRSNDCQSEEYVLKLSDVYRQILQKRESTIVTVQEELEFLNPYTYLLKLRHEKALFFDINISEESLKYNLPIFSLQLLVENCIKHNIVSESKPLHIRLFQRDLQSVSIANNYQPKRSIEESFGMGLENLRTRYELLGLNDGIQIEQTELDYCTTLKLL